MAESGKKVTLWLRADVAQLKRSLTDAAKDTDFFSGRVKEVNKGLGNMLGESKKLSDALTSKTAPALGLLTKEVQTTDRAFGAVGKKWTRDLTNLGLKIVGVGTALRLAGDYFKGAFDRAKIEPALDGLNRLRLLTESWTVSWEQSIDRIMSKLANAAVNYFGVQEDSHGNYETRRRQFAHNYARTTWMQGGQQFYASDDPMASRGWAGLRPTEENAAYQALIARGMVVYDDRYRAYNPLEGTAERQYTANPWGRGAGYAPQVEASRRRRAGRQRPDYYAAGRQGVSGLFGFDFQDAFDLSYLQGRGAAMSTSALTGAFGGAADEMGRRTNRLAGAGGEEWGDLLDKMAKKMNEVSEASQQMFGVLSSGLAAGIDALVSGQENAGKAALRASAAALRGLAVEYGVRALAAAFIPGMQGSAAGLAAAAAAAAAGSALLSGLAGGGASGASAGAGGSASVAPSAMPSYRIPSNADAGKLPSSVQVNVYGAVGEPTAVAEQIQRGLTQARVKGTGAMRSSSVTSYR